VADNGVLRDITPILLPHPGEPRPMLMAKPYGRCHPAVSRLTWPCRSVGWGLDLYYPPLP